MFADGTSTPPFMKKEDNVFLFVDDICRFLTCLTYCSENRLHIQEFNVCEDSKAYCEINVFVSLRLQKKTISKSLLHRPRKIGERRKSLPPMNWLI